MSETNLPERHEVAPIPEPWHHIVAFLAIGIVLFLITAIVFRALEGGF